MTKDPIVVAEPLSCHHSLFADVASRVEHDPAAWHRLWEIPQLRAVAYVDVPQEYNPYPFREAGLDVETCSYPLHLAVVEQLSRGSASALMALPSSSLSTNVVLKLGNRAQQERYFSPFSKGPAFSFFAITEPGQGSDATQAQTRIDDVEGGLVLSGNKMLIGGAAGATTGLVLARRGGSGPLVFALVTRQADDPTLTVERLGTTGLRGAGLTRLTFTEHRVDPDAVLSPDARLPALLALGGVFERHRPLVTAMALGTARGMIDRLESIGADGPLGAFKLRHGALLRRMITLASGDAHVFNVNTISMLKLLAVELLDAIRASCLSRASAALFTDSHLRRLWRDAAAFEYMEGTSNIHALNAYRVYVADEARLAHVH